MSDLFLFTHSFPFLCKPTALVARNDTKKMKTIIVLLSWLLLACWFVDATSTLRRSASPSSLVLDHASSHRRRSPSVPRAVRVLQAKQKRGGGDSNKSTFKGTGTWFIPSTEGGSEGACEVNNEDDAKIVALVRRKIPQFCIFLNWMTYNNIYI